MVKTHQRLGNKLDKVKSKSKSKSKSLVKKTPKAILPKGQNLTDVNNFKVKKIVVKDQVKPHDSSELLFRHKLNILELLSRLDHHNISIKTEALDGLKELVGSHPDAFRTQSGPVLVKLVKCSMDSSSSVRNASIKIVSMILPQSDSDKIRPFFPSVGAYLLCSLTHINRDIREDSLLFLDVVLKYVPRLCSPYVLKLLRVCLDLISEEKTSSRSRTLSLNLDSSSLTHKWRVKVMCRIRALLQVLLRDRKESNCLEVDPSHNFNRTIHYDRSKVNYLSLCSDPLPDSVSLSIAESITTAKDLNDYSIQTFSHNLVPILLDMVIEVLPQQEKDEEEQYTQVTGECAVILKLISQIIQLLWDILEETNNPSELQTFSGKYSNLLLNSLIRDRKFPYHISRTVYGAKDILGRELDGVTNHSLNLLLSRLVILLCPTKTWDPVLGFLKNCFRTCEKFSFDDCAVFASTLSKMCQDPLFSEPDYFLMRIVQVVNSSSTNSALVSHFFKLLTSFALDRRMSQFHSSPEFIKWLFELPKKLTTPKINKRVLDVISKIAVRGFSSFQDSLDTHIEVILDNIPHIEAPEPDRLSMQVQIAQLLYWVHDWELDDNDLAEEIQRGLTNNYWNEEVSSQILDIIEMKSFRPLVRSQTEISCSLK